MTALDRYDRLEAPGLYTPGSGAQRIDVILSLGAASLTISNARDVALAHWSLAAVERLNPGSRPAHYAPSGDTPERLETSDEDMIRAIEKIRRAVRRGRPRSGRVRRRIVLAIAALLVATGLFWLPGAVTDYAASLLPPAARAELGQAIVDQAVPLAGAACAEPAGAAALSTLSGRLSGVAPLRILVLPGAPQSSAHLPGGTVLLSREVVEDHETAQVAAGFVLAEAARARAQDPLVPLLTHAGLPATLRLMATGRLPDDALRGYAEAVLTSPPVPVDPGVLLDFFRAARVPATPYARAVDITGESTARLIAEDPVPADRAERLLSDGEWVALQSICG